VNMYAPRGSRRVADARDRRSGIPIAGFDDSEWLSEMLSRG
jgi:hypothetical protein